MMTTKEILPNATTVLILGICSVMPFFFPLGLITGIIGIVLSKKGREMYKKNPETYAGYQKLNAGFIMSIIGVGIAGLVLLWIFLYTANGFHF